MDKIDKEVKIERSADTLFGYHICYRMEGTKTTAFFDRGEDVLVKILTEDARKKFDDLIPDDLIDLALGKYAVKGNNIQATSNVKEGDIYSRTSGKTVARMNLYQKVNEIRFRLLDIIREYKQDTWMAEDDRCRRMMKNLKRRITKHDKMKHLYGTRLHISDSQIQFLCDYINHKDVIWEAIKERVETDGNNKLKLKPRNK